MLATEQVEMPLVSVARVNVKEILKLRRDVFDPTGFVKDWHLPEDDSSHAHHFSAFIERCGYPLPVSCGSFYRSEFMDSPAWLLQCMATDPAYRRMGFGQTLLCSAEEILSSLSPIRNLFCHSRLSAVPFYMSQGWTTYGKEFCSREGEWQIRMVKGL